jgi:hypothetical protein
MTLRKKGSTKKAKVHDNVHYVFYCHNKVIATLVQK